MTVIFAICSLLRKVDKERLLWQSIITQKPLVDTVLMFCYHCQLKQSLMIKQNSLSCWYPVTRAIRSLNVDKNKNSCYYVYHLSFDDRVRHAIQFDHHPSDRHCFDKYAITRNPGDNWFNLSVFKQDRTIANRCVILTTDLQFLFPSCGWSFPQITLRKCEN